MADDDFEDVEDHVPVGGWAQSDASRQSVPQPVDMSLSEAVIAVDDSDHSSLSPRREENPFTGITAVCIDLTNILFHWFAVQSPNYVGNWLWHRDKERNGTSTIHTYTQRPTLLLQSVYVIAVIVCEQRRYSCHW